MDTCVIFATSSRPQILRNAIAALNQQTVRPNSIIVSCVDTSDVDQSVGEHRRDIKIVTGEIGLTKQRNRALRHLPDTASLVVFFDDDFIPHPRWIESVQTIFARYADVVAVTGRLIADGIHGPGYTFEQAQDLIANSNIEPIDSIKEPYSPYGCNMAFRRSAIGDIWFDERLVLYGWQEDRDFGSQVARRGRIVKTDLALGVHMGVKRGRTPGIRLGYSQIANPIYLYGKGTMALTAVFDHIFRNFGSNFLRSFLPEPYVDRPGRLRGNFTAMFDLLRGRMAPERAAQL
jgi:GT2 family glycosyltransferase